MKSSAASAETQTSVHASAWPLVPLGDILTQRSPDVRVEPTRTYQFAGVYSFGRGVFRGPLKKGNEFAYPVLTRLRVGEFVYPKLMAWEGAFGVVPASCDGFLVSPEFPVFRIDASKANPCFLENYFKTANAWESLSSRSTGTNVRRRRLHPSDLLRNQVRLPSLQEQQRVVAKLAHAASLRQRIEDGQVRIEDDLRKLLLSSYWQLAKPAKRFALGEIAPLTRRPVEIVPDGDYPAIAVRSFGRGTFHKPSLKGDELTWQKLFRVKTGDLLFSNIKAWEGAVAVVKPSDNDRFGSHRYLTCVPKEDIVTANFVWFHLMTSEGLRYLGDASPGSADRNRTLGNAALSRIPIPAPPIEQQRRFDDLCQKVEAVRAAHTIQLADLDALERSMLAAAFRGELVPSSPPEQIILAGRPSDARTYLVQWIPALLREVSGSLSLEEISRAYALLFQPDTLLPLIEATGGAPARRHFAKLPPLDATLFMPMLQELHRAGVIERAAGADELCLQLGHASLPPIAQAVAEDATLLAAILTLVPRETLRAETRKLCPNPGRDLFAALR